MQKTTLEGGLIVRISRTNCKILFENFFGSPTWTRTRDLRINSPSLYRLSYQGIDEAAILTAEAVSVNLCSAFTLVSAGLSKQYINSILIVVMDKKTIFIKTPKGESEMSSMSGDMKRVMLLIDNKSTFDEVTRRAPPSLRSELTEIVQQLLESELIRDKAKPVTTTRIVAPKMAIPKVASALNEELDFTNMGATSQSSASIAEDKHKQQREAEAEAKAKQKAKATRAYNELKASVAAAKLKAIEETKTKAEAQARQDAQIAARAKAEAEADAKAKQEATERQLAEAKVQVIKRAEQEAARVKAEQEAARVKTELETIEKAKAEAEAARIKAEQEAAKVKAKLEAAKARAEAEAKALAKEIAKQEAEAARLKAEHEAALIRAAQEAAARAKAQAEELAKQEAEAARIKAEQEAARIKAEQEAAARARADAEAARIKAEQEAARIRAEQETARVQAELEVARVRAEEKVKAQKEERARLEAAERDRAELEAIKRQAEETARLNAEIEEATRQATATRMEAEEKAKRDTLSAAQMALSAADIKTSDPGFSSFQINLDAFNLGTVQTPVQSEVVQPNLADQAEAKAREQATQEAERRVVEEEHKARLSAAAEMARMKADMESIRLRSEQEARAKSEEQDLAEEQANAWAEAEQRAKLQAKLDAEQTTQQSAISQAKAEQKPVTRARRKPLPLAKIFFGLIVLALAAAIILPYVWPMQKYIASIEQTLSVQLKQPVHLGGMSAATFPPKLQLRNITVGNSQELKIATAVLNFDPTTIFSANKTISNIELQGIVLDGWHLEQVAGWLHGLAGNEPFGVRHLTISSLQVSTDEITLPSLKGSAELEQGAFTRVVLHSEDEKMNVELLPVKNSWIISYGIKEMALPILPAVQFSDFSAKGDIGDGVVNFTEIEAHAYGGAWSGNGVLGWRKGWHAQGHMQAKEMDLEKIYPKIGTSSEVQVEGTYLLQGVKLSQMNDAPHFDGSFMAKDGVINGVGMMETARLLSQEHLPGERTSFDELNGTVQLENHNLHFHQVKINSNTFTANGTFDISATNQLSGNFNTEIKERAGNNPLVLSGTLTEPKLQLR